MPYSNMLHLIQVKPYLPFEYTYEGMLERVFALLKYQDFCSPPPSPQHMWPPVSAKRVFIGEAKEPCDEVCFKKGIGIGGHYAQKYFVPN